MGNQSGTLRFYQHTARADHSQAIHITSHSTSTCSVHQESRWLTQTCKLDGSGFTHIKHGRQQGVAGCWNRFRVNATSVLQGIHSNFLNAALLPFLHNFGWHTNATEEISEKDKLINATQSYQRT